MRTLPSILALVALFLAPSLCFADESMGTPAARAQFEKGETARWTGNFRFAVEAYRRAIQIDPDFAKAHENYILYSQFMPPNLQEISSLEKRVVRRRDDDALQSL